MTGDWIAPLGEMESSESPCAPLSDVGRTMWSVPSAVRTNAYAAPPVPGIDPTRVNFTAAMAAAGTAAPIASTIAAPHSARVTPRITGPLCWVAHRPRNRRVK